MGLTRLESRSISSPGIAEAAIVLECRVIQTTVLPPGREIFFAEVSRVSAHKDVVTEEGRLLAKSRKFYGMTSGSGEFWSFGEKVGHIGMTANRDDIRY